MTAPAPARGRLVVFEGGEASGKSTQAALAARRMGALLTREPGGTPTGERLRQLILDPDLPALDARAEALLLLAARAQHVARVIEPALVAGRDVVCDRFSGSTVAYQGYGRGLDPAQLACLSRWSSAGVEPDLVVLLVVPPGVAAARMGGRGPVDRMEGEDGRFFARVEDGFRAQAQADPRLWRVVDGDGTVEEVAVRVAAALGALRPVG